MQQGARHTTRKTKRHGKTWCDCQLGISGRAGWRGMVGHAFGRERCMITVRCSAVAVVVSMANIDRHQHQRQHHQNEKQSNTGQGRLHGPQRSTQIPKHWTLENMGKQGAGQAKKAPLSADCIVANFNLCSVNRWN